jgi:L-lysine 2,3-aminomutase
VAGIVRTVDDLAGNGGPLGVAPVTPERASWRRDLADAFRDPADLGRFLGLPPAVTAEAACSTTGFPFLVPRGFAARMRPGDPLDPLLLQVLPRAAETTAAAGYSADPLAERTALAAPGLVRKYAGRALVLDTGACAVNCRYCFRREFPYAESGATAAGLEEALEATHEPAAASLRYLRD